MGGLFQILVAGMLAADSPQGCDMNGVFKSLEDEGFFVDYVTAHLEKAPAATIQDFPCKHTIDTDRYFRARRIQSEYPAVCRPLGFEKPRPLLGL